MGEKEKLAVVYMPVLHQGYLRFLDTVQAKDVYIVQASDVSSLPHLTREIRSLTFAQLKKVLASFGYNAYPFSSLTKDRMSVCETHVAEDDVTRKLLLEGDVVWSTAFLRWDWSKSTAKKSVSNNPDVVITKDHEMYLHHQRLLLKAFNASSMSSDWWRQVGALVLTLKGECLVGYNKHYPHEHSPYMDGDPRDNFNPGEFIEVSTALHGERALIAEAARKGFSLEGASMYTTTFPCNDCANMIVVSGIRKVFFTGGYSNLNGEKTLKDHNVTLVFLE